MGQQQSVETVVTYADGSKFDIMNPIVTRDQLLARYMSLAATLYFGHDESVWLEAISNKFCTRSESRKYWTQSDLADFLYITSPSRSASFITAAAPILHHTMINLGNFPYHNRAAQCLTPGVLQHAIMVLLRRKDYLMLRATSDEDEEERVTSKAENLQVTDGILRTKDDDEDLLEVLELVSQHNIRRQSNPKVVARGATLPDAKDLPSSFSQELDKLISRQDLQSLIRLFLVIQLYILGYSLHHSLETINNLDQVTERMLKAFLEDGHNVSQEGVCWKSFDRVISRSMPNIPSGFAQLLSPFILTKPTLFSKLNSSTRIEAEELLRSTFLFLSPKAPIEATRILNLPLLCQFATFSPVNDPFILYSSDGFDLCTTKHHLVSQKGPSMLLISGTLLHHSSGLGNKHVGLGVYICEPQYAATNDIFQYEPKHMVFRTALDKGEDKLEYPNLFKDSENVSRLAFIANIPDIGYISLTLDGKSQVGSLSQANRKDRFEDRTLLLENFRIDCVELVRFGKENASNMTFEVSGGEASDF